MSVLSDMLIHLRKTHGLSQQGLADHLGVSRSSIGMYETGKREPDLETLELLADFYRVDMNTLTGSKGPKAPSTLYCPENVLPLPATKEIPLLGTIACGEPILAVENIETRVQCPTSAHADFALRCKGDSMIGAHISDGDLIYIRQQDDVDNGQIAAVIIDEEATLKRVYKHPDHIVLAPENPIYPPMVYAGEELEQVHIIGLAVGYTHYF